MAAKKPTKTTSPKKPAAAKPAAAKPAAAKPAAAKPAAGKKPLAEKAKAAAKGAAAPAKVAATAPAKPSALNGSAKPAGVVFKSAAFRLTVINELLDLGHFADAFEEAQESAEEVEALTFDPRVQKFVDEVVLTSELLAQIVKVGPSAEDLIYEALVPGWEGEDDRFDIDSLDDLRLLPNLERVSLFDMVAPDLDLTPLRDVPTLTHVNINVTKKGKKGWAVLDELDARGVEVTEA